MTKQRGPNDPFAAWREWLDHRYDPGHYLGGRIHPFYRAIRTRSKFGLGVGLALIAVVAAVAAVFFPSARAVLLIYALIMAALAVANIREARKARPPRDRADDEP